MPRILQPDRKLFGATLALCLLGTVMVYSASIATAEAMAYTGYRPWYFLARHAVFVAVGILMAVIAFQVPVKVWQRLAPYEKFAAMIDRHWDGIAAYCKPENKVSLGFVEGLNNKIRVIQRRAYGLRNEDYLRLKILTCMLPAL